MLWSVADANPDLARKIGRRYNVNAVTLLDDMDFSIFDLVSITTPTPTHAAYLHRLMESRVPVIICEKPVASTVQEMDWLTGLYHRSESKVIINYMRRFQPAYIDLKKEISKRKSARSCTAMIVKYQRGFLNNGGHAFDMLEFLFDEPCQFEDFRLQSAIFDAFDYDPTVTGSCVFKNCPVSIVGVTGATYPVFEIELFFPDGKIVICHSGDEIRHYRKEGKNGPLIENKEKRVVKILSRYMLPVMQTAIKLLRPGNNQDNFLQAVSMNKRMAAIIESLVKNRN